MTVAVLLICSHTVAFCIGGNFVAWFIGRGLKGLRK